MLQRFLSYLGCELNYSAHTLRAYSSDLDMLADFVTGGKPHEFEPSSVTLNDLRAWISEQAARGLSARTLRRRTLAARTFFHFLRKNSLISHNPAADLPLPRLPQPLPTFVAEQEMEHVLSAELFETDDFSEFRDLLIVDLLYSTGMRRAELLSLTEPDVDTRKGEVKITGKRRKQRIVPLAPQLCERIEKYRRLRSERFELADASVFLLDDSGRPVNNSALSRIVKEKLLSTSTSRKTPHVLRHSFATAMLRNNARLDSVKELLGHSSIATTQIYTHLSFSELQNNYQLAHPRASKTQDHGSKN